MKSETNGGAQPGPPPVPVPSLGMWPTAVGLVPDEENKLHGPEVLAQLVAMHCQWVDSIGGMFDMMEQEKPGHAYGLQVPECSLYDGLDVTW